MNPTKGPKMNMTAPKFTPGPWRYDEESSGILSKHSVAPGSREVAAVNPALADQVTGANARLIAAAPELYEALAACEHALRSYQYGNGAPDLAEEVANKASAALAKVTP